ncbi:MAG: SUMF1/EgtB/PvdO family nonheme iron enzyme, partial [Bacteroidales bacterium]|nr:SUMF1/EgtB/PvdO family nonheme iron enzyme [Bacteroidales bacterium]
MKSLDAKNLSILQDIYNSTPDIQITKTTTFALVDDNENVNEQSIEKPNIEFVDLPGGTFTMGSPVTELGRQDDEIQHDVTLSPFKMSKFCVTYEQFDAFCEAAGRKKPWGFKRGNMPV